MTFFDRNVGRRVASGAAVTALAILAAACIFAPGKFTSSLDLRTDHTFRFSYVGEIVMLPLQKSKEPVFEPQACYDDNYETRTCSQEELAEQKAQWDQARAEKRRNDSEAAQMFLGGLDPYDPRAGEEVAVKLRRQAGWNKVTYKGDGRFDVDFAVSGNLDHDFAFPTVEGFPMSNAFVQLALRKDGTVRVDAPSFGPLRGAGLPPGAALSGLADTANVSAAENETRADGVFTITTDGEILANNTDEGPVDGPDGRQLTWAVNARTANAPTALVKLEP